MSKPVREFRLSARIKTDLGDRLVREAQRNRLTMVSQLEIIIEDYLDFVDREEAARERAIREGAGPVEAEGVRQCG